jgi:transposase
VVDKKAQKVICTAFANGKMHDFMLYKQSRTYIAPNIKTLVDTGYLGICKLHSNSELPKKKSKKNPLTKEDKAFNRGVSRQRITNEHAIGFIKRFKIIADRYRNRRKRFGLRFNLIAGICNFELGC